MMSREERIEYEILDCVLNRAIDSRGWPTSVRLFVSELRQLFPDAKSQEVVEASKRLAMTGALVLSKKEPLSGSAQRPRGGLNALLHNYEGEHEDGAFFYEDRGELWFQRAPMTRAHFQKLRALVEPPSGFKDPSTRTAASMSGRRFKQSD